MIGFWILLLLLAIFILAAPWWPYSRTWSYWPGGVVLVLLLIWLVLLWAGWVAVLWPWAAIEPA